MTANAFYQRSRGSNNRSSVVEELVKMPSPIHEGVEHVFKMRVIESESINETTYKSPYNKRSADHLSMGAVMDILPEIRRDKRNTHPAIGFVDKDGNIEILGGMRRRKAVSLVEGGEFYVLACSTLDEKEKARIALTSDVYSEPTAVDIGFSICELRQQKAENGEAINRDELAEIFEISTGKVSECISFASLPSDLYSLFPSLSSISYRFLREAVKLHKAGEQQFRAVINEAISAGMRVAINGSDTQDTIKARCKELETEFLILAKPFKKPQAVKDPVTRWKDIKKIKGVGIKTSRNGVISLKIDEHKADKATIDKIYELLAK